MGTHVNTIKGSDDAVVVLLSQVGGEVYVFDFVTEESAQWTINKVNKPVEEGAPVTDHARRELDKLDLSVSLDDREQLAQLRALMNAFTVVDVVAGLAVHPSMMLTTVSPTRGITESIDVRLSFEEWRVAATRLVQLPGGSTARRGGRGQTKAEKEAAAIIEEGMTAAEDTADAITDLFMGRGGGSENVAEEPAPNTNAGVWGDNERVWP